MKTLFQFKTIVLAVMLFLPTIGFAASFDYIFRGVEFRCVVKDGKATIVAYDNDAVNVVIPSTVSDKHGRSYPVECVNLYDEALSYKTTQLVIDKGIVEISARCFLRFGNLNVVYIPTTVERIGKNAFNTKHMPSFKMPATINEADLRKGLAVAPKNDPNAMFRDLDLADYDGGVAQTPSEDRSHHSETAPKKPAGIAVGTSDVDYNIPTSGARRENTFGIIIANEDYQQAPKVDYAAVDGETFRKYCINTLGMPEKNIKAIKNAGYLDMQEQFDWLKKIADMYGDEANFIVYYAGHGVPGDDGNCYLLPVEGNPKKATTNGYSLKKLYDMLGSISAQSSLVLIDACFSGSDRKDVSMLGNDRGIVRKVKDEKVEGNVVVISAASSSETALPYEEKGHGMFTYFLLKKLQETKGKVKYGDLYDYIHKQVTRRSTVEMDKPQTPSVTYSGKIANEWKEMSF